MPIRAANAFRFLAVLMIVQTIKGIAFTFYRKSMMDSYAASSGDSHDMIERVKLVAKIQMWTHIGFTVVLFVGLIVLVTTLTRGRGTIIAALVTLGLYTVVWVYQKNASFDGAGSQKTMYFVFWLQGTLHSIAWALPIIAGAQALPEWRHRLLAQGGMLLILAISIVFDGYATMGQHFNNAAQWLFIILDVAFAAWFAAFAFPIAKMIQNGGSAIWPVADNLETLDGAPLRTIGWTILLRVGIGMLLTIVSIGSAMRGSGDMLGEIAIGSTVLGGLCTLFLIGGIAGYAKYPAFRRSEMLAVVMGLLVIGLILAVFGAYCTTQLLSAIEKARSASSMWGMPSMSRLENLQSYAVWCGRGSMVAGLASLLLLLASFATTARSSGNEELASLAGRTMVLVTIAIGGALAMGVFLTSMKRSNEGIALFGALALLCVAIGALVNVLRLAFGIARAVEAPTTLPVAEVVQR